MDVKIKRQLVREDGIFSSVTTLDDVALFVALEHNYNGKTKIPVGEFRCVRGMHRLHSSVTPFETFEITGVEGHSGLLFHAGNYNRDSSGCVLIGDEIAKSDSQPWMITNTRKAFTRFMKLQDGLQEFKLIVE